MHFGSRYGVALVVGAALLSASCSDTTAPSNPGTPDLATLLNDMSLSNVAGPAAAGVPVVGAVLGGPALAPSSCAFAPDKGSFICPTVTVNGLTFTRSFTLRDAAGHIQSKPDATTASIETVTSVDGTITLTRPDGPTSTLTIHRTEDMTLSGINTRTRTLNGTAQSTTSSTFTGAPGGGSLTSTTTSREKTSNLVLPDPRAGQRWPQSGTISIDATTKITPNGRQEFTSTVHIEIAYDGTSWVTITTTTGVGTSVCRINMASPGSVSCSQPVA